MQTSFEVNNNDYLRKMATRGFKKRGLSGEKYETRLRDELDIITDANLSDFFLNTSYICNLLKSHGMFLGPGRGSAGGSLVCYCLNIVAIDPLKEDLMFSRFINKTRIKNSMPDIDTDIPKTRRQEALDLIKDKFGRDCAFSIPNLVKFTIKTSIKDVARVFNVPFQEVNKVTQLITDDMTVEDVYKIEKVKEFFGKYPDVEQNFQKINGLIRSYSIHAGGTLLFPDSIENYSSTVKVNGVECVAYDGHRCDSLKFLKNDTLGLNTLSIIEDTISLIKDDFELPKEFEDPKVYETILANPLNIFQLETPAASSYIHKMRPNSFEELIAALALVRPGAQDSGDADNYVAIKSGEKEIVYDDPKLEPILKETNGAIIYQEQAMKICMVLAGLSDVDADNIRKGIGKKLDYIFTEYKPKFIQGCIDNGVSETVANKIWNKIEKSSSYSFNKAHAQNYAVISYYTGYLKTYYPAEFSIACLNHTKDDEKKNKILTEIKNMNLNLHNPDINFSKSDTVFRGNDIYMGLSTIDKVGDKAVDDILSHQPYFSFDIFLQKRIPRKVNKSVVNNLIYAGAFDSFGKRNDIYNTFNSTQEQWTEKDMLKHEYAVLKFSPHEELLNKYDTEYDKYISPIDTIDTSQEVDEIFIKGICVDIDNKKGYSILHLQESGNNISVSVNNNVRNRYVDHIKVGDPYIVKCHIWNHKFYAHFFINLEEDEALFKDEYAYLDGSLALIVREMNKELEVPCYALIKKITYFKSKRGNDCARIDGYDTNDVLIISCANMYNNLNPNFIASDVIKFNFSKKPFASISLIKQKGDSN